MSSHTLTIRTIERIKNSTNGNPRYHLTFTDGSNADTTADSSYADLLGNPGYREGDVVIVTLSGHKNPKISKIERYTPSAAETMGTSEQRAVLGIAEEAAATFNLTADQRQTMWSIVQREYESACADVIEAERNEPDLTAEVKDHRAKVDALRKLLIPDTCTHSMDIKSDLFED